MGPYPAAAKRGWGPMAFLQHPRLARRAEEKSTRSCCAPNGHGSISPSWEIPSSGRWVCTSHQRKWEDLALIADCVHSWPGYRYPNLVSRPFMTQFCIKKWGTWYSEFFEQLDFLISEMKRSNSTSIYFSFVHVNVHAFSKRVTSYLLVA